MMSHSVSVSACRVCGGLLSLIFCDLGQQPLANSYVRAGEDVSREPRLPLRACVCSSCRLVQLDTLADAHAIFSDYAYLSSVSSSWVEHARDYCRQIMAAHRPGFVVELASNDGYLLQHFRDAGIKCLGIEPAANVAEMARAKGIETVSRFFGLALAQEFAAAGRRADLIVANNVLAHVPDVNDFTAGIKSLLAPGGLVTIECPHLVELVRNVQFDTIYHEHYAYWSLLSLEHLLSRHDLRAVDVERLKTHGGSLRIHARHVEDRREASSALRDLREEERELGLWTDGFYRGFESAVDRVVHDMRAFLADCRARQESIAAYGAAAKGNTFLNRLGLGPSDIACVADANPIKQGRLLPGSHIPVVAPQDMAAMRPDHVIVLPWNIATEVEQELIRLGLSGANMVTAIPCLHQRRIGA